MSQREVLVSWSGGKDSCMALYEIQRAGEQTPVALVTTLTEGYDRISMHGVRRTLLERQAEALGLPLCPVIISIGASNEEYEAKLLEAVSPFRKQGVDSIVFGDLFLADIKRYREEFLALHQLRGLFPVWQRDTTEFINDFLAYNFKAIVTCVDLAQLDSRFAGRVIDDTFVNDLPAGVDPCGENGEFHTFVFDGPNFARPVEFRRGEIVERDGFSFCDLF